MAGRSELIAEVQRFMRREDVLPPGAPTLVAVSGGADSMVLLHVLRALGHPCSVVHVDHGLRGAESDGDRAFVEEHCEKLGIPCHIERVDVRSLTDKGAASTQMAARALRQACFERMHAAKGLPVAQGHHADDTIETLFIHLLRGTGVRGWAGILPKQGIYRRPLLSTSRAAIRAFASENAIPFREDSSNAERDYLRNRIRLDLLPLLEDLRPGASKTIARSISDLRGLIQAALPEEAAVEGPCCIARASALEDPLRLRSMLRPLGFHPALMDRVWDALLSRSTGVAFSSAKWRISVARDGLVIEHADT